MIVRRGPKTVRVRALPFKDLRSKGMGFAIGGPDLVRLVRTLSWKGLR